MGSVGLGPKTLVFLLATPAIIILPVRYIPAALSGSTVAALALYWEGLVSGLVPEPYLDEIFHIPQAQAYCNGNFDVWDPKLTTPPGLYLLSTVVLSSFECAVESLRTVNALTLALLLLPIFACRNYIYISKEQNWDAAHTALNICLFPPLFFFSGLYYTDVLSTLLVVLTYSFYLQNASNFVRGFGIYVLGITALGMRQTNIFWVAVFLAGLDWVRTCETKGTTYVAKEQRDTPSTIGDWGDQLEKWTHGSLHDPKVGDASVTDVLLCALSIAVAALCNPVLLITRIWPYLALLLSFAGFIFWNGGVVLGDKSNHVATIHAPQMLYLWPFIGFFSVPLLFPYVLDTLASFVPPSVAKHIGSQGSIKKPIRFLVYLTAATLIAVAAVHVNTLIHPFTLADNRHYMFYVFRYTILRHPYVKYALAPFYVIGAWLVLRSLGGLSTAQTEVSSPNIAVKQTTLKQKVQGADTSFAIIWVLSTALSLITAPLVEPRYFIIPWVMWRLHVPSIKTTNTPSTSSTSAIIPPPQFPLSTSNGSQNGLSTSHPPEIESEDIVETHDNRLYLETLWFLAINVVTGYMFLYRGFEWPQEPGNVQRFMW